ncbi:glycine cleavage system aminomethyltransferase GcvT [Aeromicrobium duanguangcaii]|uniref:Aminomethyltransferase n=1 Tax=Aeromicrobium duanguangcaii TaxID=2968086 RepID=A0ABY5KID0_9ACTN|nr:glycine cleavage system aminomethyltransferase GcvT [Aeromicrobium duanguangcaii]MCD9153305.1 glycine cleavage system aminomethyltransferase GcvT [Aeromicrobium duanguangcaii]MCL3836704.1 glycine cleavage system aminomethyltransferase GcvT [Aeromicrobium duanguangcaii]UUI69600.1 glycine cleavage system aminomethyltransferase GcvT [Aeromicrobium duanguangcaii]
MDLLQSPLRERHEALGAKFSEFGGWSMPLEYAGGGVLAEHKAVREAVGLFDVSHLGKALVRGTGAAEFVNSCLTNDLGRIAPGKAQYTLCCSEDGGTVDDLIAYLRSDFEVFLIPNAANNAEVVRLLQAAAPEGVEVENQHRDHAVLAIQGPLSDELLGALGLPADHEYMSFTTGTVEGVELTVCRTGYTGERGYELVVPAEDAVPVWDAVMAAGESLGIRACGLASRDTLRTEMGYPLHGHELSAEVTPVMARTGWAVGWSKPAFWGKEALERQRAEKKVRTLRGLLSQGRGIPRPGMAVHDADGGTLGEVTSGTFSPTLRQGIGLALLEPSVEDGSTVTVDVRGRRESFTVTKPPFVRASTKES